LDEIPLIRHDGAASFLLEVFPGEGASIFQLAWRNRLWRRSRSGSVICIWLEVIGLAQDLSNFGLRTSWRFLADETGFDFFKASCLGFRQD